jgi:hypothetical protein
MISLLLYLSIHLDPENSIQGRGEKVYSKNALVDKRSCVGVAAAAAFCAGKRLIDKFTL